VKSSTYVRAVEAFQSQSGRVTFVRVELASGHKFTCQPEEAPKVGEHWEVTAEPSVETPLPLEVVR
jgi:hypothetical protein